MIHQICGKWIHPGKESEKESDDNRINRKKTLGHVSRDFISSLPSDLQDRSECQGEVGYPEQNEECPAPPEDPCIHTLIE